MLEFLLPLAFNIISVSFHLDLFQTSFVDVCLSNDIYVHAYRSKHTLCLSTKWASSTVCRLLDLSLDFICLDICRTSSLLLFDLKIVKHAILTNKLNLSTSLHIVSFFVQKAIVLVFEIDSIIVLAPVPEQSSKMVKTCLDLQFLVLAIFFNQWISMFWNQIDFYNS